jgi:hypothetical protein
MTIDGKSFDGWPISPAFQTILGDTPQPKGRDLAQAIVWALEEKGIKLHPKRVEAIIEACEKPLE